MAKSPTRRGAQKRAVEAEQDNGNLSSVAQEMVAPTEANIREVRTRIEDVFTALGTEALPGTVLPVGTKNNSKEAADYLLADLLAKLADKRKKEAFQAAEKAGVFGDPADYVAGDTVMVFNDPNFSINVKKGNPTRMIGREEVEAAARKYLGKKADEFLEECKKDRSATTQIIVSMK
jgi:hypothetical protein